MRHLKLTVSYDGTDYVGWQVQDNGISVQQRLEEAWFSVTQEKIRITASGRTDAGVHAVAQVCSLQTRSPIELERIAGALNANSPFDIVVLDAREAPMGFHAIRDATGKTYRYQIQFGRKMDVLSRRFHWFVPRSLDVDAMRTAASYLVGKHDFVCFQTTGSDRLSTVRNVTRLDITHRAERYFDYVNVEISADGFLYNMVRSIVGTLVRVGQGTRPVEWVESVLDSLDRKQAGQTAPAQGLFLVNVEYDGGLQ